MTIEDFRALRDTHGLALYAESVETHRAKLAALADPALRRHYFPEWGSLSTKERGNVVRAAIAYERGEIERVSNLYDELKQVVEGRQTA